MKNLVKQKFMSMYKMDALFMSLGVPLFLSIFAYVYAWAIPAIVLVLCFFWALEFINQLFHAHLSIRATSALHPGELPATVFGRIVQTILHMTFWGGAMYVLIWSDRLSALIYGVLIFGTMTFVLGEYRARKPKFGMCLNLRKNQCAVVRHVKAFR